MDKIIPIYKFIEFFLYSWYTSFQNLFPQHERGIELFILFIMAIILVVILSVVMVMLIVQRLYNNHVGRKMGALIQRLDVLGTLPVPTKEFQQQVVNFLKPREYPYFERYIRNKLSAAGAVSQPHLLHLAKFSGFNSHIKKRIKRAHGWNRTLALRTLSYLRNSANIPLFRESMLNAETVNQQFAAALGLALCRDFNYLETIVHCLYHPADPNRDQILAVFEAYGPDACKYVCTALNKDEFTETIQTVFMDFLRVERYTAAEQDIIRLLDRCGNGEVRISAIETLGIIGAAASIPVVRKYLKDEHFVVRLKALVAAGKLDGEKMTETLVFALDDADWWVRRNAAETLYHVGTAGVETLTRIAREETSRRSTTARMVLAEEIMDKQRLRYRFV